MLNKTLNREAFESSGRVNMRVNREYMLRKGVAADFNKYMGFSPFKLFADIMSGDERAALYKAKNDGTTYNPKVGTPGVPSLFNRYGGVPVGDTSQDIIGASDWRISNNVPLIDTPDNRVKMRLNSGCSIKELVAATQSGALGRAIYSYSDFMYCKYLGRVPNTYMITLRRFPTPVGDYISSTGVGQDRLDKDISSKDAFPIGELVTWMNTPGNNMEDILKYSVSMPYDEKTAQWESNNIDADSSDKPLNAIAAMFDKTYREQYQKGQAATAANRYISKFFPTDVAPYHDMIGWQDKNKVYGPVDAVKKVYYRGDQGIDFNQSISLTFEYELRSYNGINGRQALLDLISNILNVTYTTGTFWGGGYTPGGAHQNNIFSNLEIFKTNNGLNGFVDAFLADASNIWNAGRKSVQEQGGIIPAIKNFFNDLGGMLAGGFLNKLGRPQKVMLNSLLSPAATGLWHVTIGNPFHPIMSMGNMVLKSTEISHSGPLGIDDFPTGIKVVCELERGKPRDLREIEMMYMNGNDRIYYSMGPHVFDMYNKAKTYKYSENANVDPTTRVSLTKEYSKIGGLSAITKTSSSAVNNLSFASANKLKKYFGSDDQYAISVPAMEQEYGAFEKPKGSKKGK